MVAFERAVIEDAPFPWLAKRRPFDANEDRAVIWAYQRGWPLKKIAAQCNRHWTSVQQRINLLVRRGELAKRAPIRNRPWTRQELARLAVRWGTEPDADLAREFGRSVHALKIAATRKLRQARKANLLSARQVGRIFGVNSKTVTHSWRARGWLGGGVRSPVGHGRHRMWHFDTEALLGFVREYSHVYDLATMDPDHWLSGHARQAWSDPWLTVEQGAAEVPFVAETLRQWCRRGLLPHQRRLTKYTSTGGMFVFRRSDLLRVAADQPEREVANRSRAQRVAAPARIARLRRPTGALCEGCGKVELVWPQRRSCSRRCKRVVDARTAKAKARRA